ncbi:MAG: sulfatase [Saprospiraceae bacterium]
MTYSLSRSATYLIALVYCIFITACRTEPSSSENDAKPNIVFILIDDLGWADLSCYGNTFHQTPNIDKLASRGMLFTDAYAPSAVCSPSRAAIMSGQYPARVGMTDFIPGHWRPYERLTVPINRTQHLPLEEETFAEALKQEGYTTGYYGKWHLGWGEFAPEHQGFDDVAVSSGWGHFFPPVKTTPDRGLPEGTYLADGLTTLAEDFITANRDTNFLLVLAHFAVHVPLEAKEEKIAKYANYTGKGNGVNNPTYAAMLESVDESVGRIVAKLEELGLTDNTAIFFFSDNGGLRQIFDKRDDIIVTNNAPLRDEKGTIYEGGIRVPMLAVWPGHIPAGSRSAEPVDGVDLFPTFCEIAGLPEANWPDKLDGKSLLPELTAQAGLDREALYFHYPHYHHSTPASAIRVGDYKLIEFLEDHHLELYDLSKDIGESHDLSIELPQLRDSLYQQLQNWQRSVNAPMPTDNPDFDPSRRLEWGKHPG